MPRLLRVAWTLLLLLAVSGAGRAEGAGCDMAAEPGLGDLVSVYDPVAGTWFGAGAAGLPVGTELLYDGHLFRVSADGLHDVGRADPAELADADVAVTEVDSVREPVGESWVLVLADDASAARHARLGEVEPGTRLAFQGRVYEALGSERVEAVRATGEALGRVVQTFVRTADAVIDVVVGYADGGWGTLTGTPNHPFWVPAIQDYVALEDLRVGTVLRTYGGSEATVLGLTFRKGDVEVYDVEVEGLHNFFVRGPGSDAPGVLVHNSTAANAAGDAAQEGQTVYRVWGGESGSGGQYWSRTDPSTVDNYRDAAGLPNGNSGQFVSEGRLVDTTGVEVTPGGAAPLHGNAGGIDEIKIPNPESQVELTGVSGVNPEF